MKLAAVLVWQLLHWTVPDGICGGVVIPSAVVPLWQVWQAIPESTCGLWSKYT